MMSGPMKALLGVLAVAGYQNREKIAEIIRGIQNPQKTPAGGPTEAAAPQPGGSGGIFAGPGGFGDLLGGLTTGGILSGGLGDLLKTFQQNGHGEKADSWIKPGPNAGIDDGELAEALGPDVLNELAAKTGLSRDEILSRLTRDLPTAVDDLTPDGKVPDASDGASSPSSTSANGDQIPV